MGSTTEADAAGFRFDVLIERAPDAIVVCDASGRIVLVNAETERLFGYPRDELAAQPVGRLLPGLSLEPGETPYQDELAARRKDGGELPVEVSLSRADTAEGHHLIAFVRAREPAAGRSALARVVSAVEEQRHRIAAEIHDDSIQVMTAVGMRLQILRRSLESSDQVERVDELEETIRLSIARLRRLIFELRSPALDLNGLGVALRMVVEQDADSGAVYEIDDHLAAQPPEESRAALYRIAQEALANVRQHAAARHVTVTLAEQAGGYHLAIADDGAGFDQASAAAGAGTGLAVARERAELAGGWLRVESAPGRGTSVECWIGAAPGETRE